jgi:CBS domain-containing membrane protein
MTLKVRDLMSPDVETLFIEETMDLANTIITLGRIRHLPVVERSGKLVGVLSHRDLLRAFAELYREGRGDADQERVSVSDIMTKDVTTVGPDDPLLDAAEIIWENKFGCLPVVVDDHVVGILTESDFVRSTIQQLSSEVR